MTKSIFAMSMSLAATAACLFAATAAAHHSNSMYDLEAVESFSGVVTRYEWASPHVYVYVETLSEEGTGEVWEIEAGPPALMTRLGWSADSFTPGARVQVRANPHRNAARRKAFGVSVISEEDGVERLLNGSPALLDDPPASFTAPEHVPAETILGRWVPSGENIPGLTVGVAAWPLTPKGRASLEAYTPAQSLAKDCTPFAAPFSMVWPTLTIIETRGDDIVLRTAIIGDEERLVHMTLDSHEGAPYSIQGHSIGRWEGEALVVDTARFAEHREGNAGGLPSSTGKHLIERFELSQDRTSLTYSYELEDPEYLTAAVTASGVWEHRPDLVHEPSPCNLDNARRYLE